MFPDCNKMDNFAQRGPEWTCSQVIRLIKEYGERPALWNPECDDYKNKIRKHQQWMELAAIFKCNKLEVERKMKILNSQYRRERHKAVKLRKAGVPHRITWYGYKSFAFLNRIFKTKRNDLIKEEPLEDGQDSLTSELPYLHENAQNKMHSSDLLSSYINENEIYGSGDDTKVNESTSHENFANESYNAYERDEWTVFGELIAHGLRKLPNERLRCIMKYKINTILYEAELASYRE